MRKKKVLFLRKKVEGQNSMEELALSLELSITDLEIVVLPYYSTSLMGMVKNGLWARKHQGKINHIFSITEGYLSLFLSGKKIITVHDLYFHHFSFFAKIAIYVFWLLLPSFFTDRYTCISKVTLKHLLKIMPWLKKKTEVIYNPLSEDYYRLYTSIPNPKPVILHIGTAIHKNLQNVIDALMSIDCKLIIVGKLSNEQASKLSNNNIDYENYLDISRSQLIDLYKRADIVSFPSSQEGFGMIVIEANAMGTPVVAGDIPVLHEVGMDAALFVKPSNVEEIKKSFQLLLGDARLRETYIRAGHINAQRFQPKTISQKYHRIYETLGVTKSCKIN